MDEMPVPAILQEDEKLEKARRSPPNPGYLNKVAFDVNEYNSYKRKYIKRFGDRVRARKGVRSEFIHKCAADEWEKQGKPENPTQGGSSAPFNADHMHDAAFEGPLSAMSNFKMMDGLVNVTVGGAMRAYRPQGEHAGKPIKANESCNCPHGPD